jgi:hypothetical protein
MKKKRQDQEQQEANDLLPPSGEEKKRYTCPKCGTNIEKIFVVWLSEMSGTKNGDLKELGWKLKIAETTMSMVGIRITEGQISEKVLQRMEGIITRKLSDNERQKYEEEIKKLREMTEEKLNSKNEIIKELEMSKRDLIEKEIEKLNERIKHLEEVRQQRDRDYEKLEKEYSELKAKTRYNPSTIGYGAEATLKEDLDTNFSMQKFENIAETKKHGDLIAELRTEVESGWVNTGLKLLIDSKDKEKVMQNDVDKLWNDMGYWGIEIGLMIASDEGQLRLKDRPCSLIQTEKGLMIITSRSNRNHHLVLQLLGMFARQKYLQKLSTTVFKELIQNKLLYNKISELFNYKQYLEKAKDHAVKTEKSIKELDEFLEPKLKEISEMIASLMQKTEGDKVAKEEN